MPREYFLPAPRGGKVSKVSRGKRPWVEKWWRDVKGTEIKSASPLFSAWRRHREDKSGGEDRSRREMETLGIRRPGKIPSTIRTFNRASRGKEGGESWMATLNRASSRRRTARMHLSLSLSASPQTSFRDKLLSPISSSSSSLSDSVKRITYVRGSRSFPEDVYSSK